MEILALMRMDYFRCWDANLHLFFLKVFLQMLFVPEAASSKQLLKELQKLWLHRYKNLYFSLSLASCHEFDSRLKNVIAETSKTLLKTILFSVALFKFTILMIDYIINYISHSLFTWQILLTEGIVCFQHQQEKDISGKENKRYLIEIKVVTSRIFLSLHQY